MPGVLLTTLPIAEALRRARVEHPTLKAAPASGSVWRECVARHGVVPALCDLSRAVPDLLPDDAAVEAVKRDPKEDEALAALKAMYPAAPYSVAGRRGPKPTALYDPMRVADPAAALAMLLGIEVTIDEPAVMWATQEVRVQALPGQSPELVTVLLPPERHLKIFMSVSHLREMADAMREYREWRRTRGLDGTQDLQDRTANAA